jgi:hypothetical protein
MFARKDPPPPIKLYSDIEGGLGWWRDTDLRHETPKFIMGGVGPNFTFMGQRTGAGKGRDWEKPRGKYGVAQLSPWLLWPPDGLNLKQGTCGELVRLRLPAAAAHAAQAHHRRQGHPHRGPILDALPQHRELQRPGGLLHPVLLVGRAVAEPRFAGMLLDSRPSDPNRALQMETQHVPSLQAEDAKGETYARIAPTYFPGETNGESRLVHHITSYNRRALWDAVKTWFEGGAEASGAIRPRRRRPASVHRQRRRHLEDLSGRDAAGGKGAGGLDFVRHPHGGGSAHLRLPLGFQPGEAGQHPVRPAGETSRVLPPGEERRQTAVDPGVGGGGPGGNRSHRGALRKAHREDTQDLRHPRGPGELLEKARPQGRSLPGSARGTAACITYYWYRFADQPALLNADLTDQEREALQVRVEKLHRSWKKDRDYLAPPASGRLADLDPALIVTPPPGLEVGYVPIVTRQGPN